MWGKAGESSPVVPQHQGNRVPWFLNAWRMRGAGWSPGWVALALPTCQACTCPFRARWLGVERVQYCRHCQAPWLETTCPLRLSACAQAEPVPCLERYVGWGGCCHGDCSVGRCSALLGGVTGAPRQERRDWHQLCQAAVLAALGFLPALGLVPLLILS